MNINESYPLAIVDGNIPEQDSFTRAEATVLVQSALAWAGVTLEQAFEQIKHKDIPNLIANCEYKTIEEGINDVQEGFEQHIEEQVEFIKNWI